MTKEKLASKLDGKGLYELVNIIDQQEAIKNLLVFWYDKYNRVKIEGIFDDWLSVYPNDKIYFRENEWVSTKETAGLKYPYIEADYLTGRFITSISHSWFDVLNESQFHCRGIVIDYKDIFAKERKFFRIEYSEGNKAMFAVAIDKEEAYLLACQEVGNEDQGGAIRNSISEINISDKSRVL